METTEREREAPRGTVTALGTFDGLHRGHEAVLERAVAEAKARGLLSLAYTFTESPRNLCGQKVRRLMEPAEKERRMREMGIDVVMDVEFTPRIRDMSPRDFARMLASECGTRVAVTGEDYTFGRYAAGDVRTLRELGREFGFETVVVDTVTENGKKVSSTAMRRRLAEDEG